MADRTPIQSGVLIEDRYRLAQVLGRGGMGVVYRTHDTLLDREVAVKVLGDEAVGTDGQARLLAEAQAIAKLNHPNIVQVHDAGQLDGTPYLVMELVEGASLHEHPPADFDGILAVARQICAALEHAHSHGIVHRDLKPENVLIEPTGRVKLTDFGLARSMASRLSREGTIVGTVFYIAPEVALGSTVDGRADLYSLGVMLYELITGNLPFADADPLAVISQHLHASVVPPRAHREDLPPGLDDLVLQLLNKRAEDRPASAAEVEQAVARLEAGDLVEAGRAELSLLARFVRGRLVGRERELAQARAAWQRVSAGEGQVLLISGEPGVGKSRLVRELAILARVSGGRTLTGQAFQTEGSPYGPVAQMIRDSLDAEEQLPLPDSVLTDLLTVAPSLRTRYPELPAAQPLDPQGEKQRVFESLVVWCTQMVKHEPLLLVFEDLHWADSLSLSVLRHLARRLTQSRVLIVGTYREVEVLGSGSLADLLLDLNRERLADRIKLSRLDRRATRELLGSMFAEEITPDFGDGVFRETEGNPFFVEEVCKALVDSGNLYFAEGRWHWPSMEELNIPQSIRLAVDARVRALPEPTQDTLRLAAVFGRDFEYALLERASELDEVSVIEALESAERAQLIEPKSSGPDLAFGFTHALIPSSLYEELGSLRLRRVHRRVAEAIEALHPQDFEALAHHFAGAGDRTKAIDYSHRAALRSQELHAYDAARAHLTQALTLLEPGEPPELRLSIVEQLADLHDLLGEPDRAVDSYREALALWETSQRDDPVPGIRLHRKIVETINRMRLFADRQRYESQTAASTAEALRLSENLPPHPEIVRLRIVLATGDLVIRTEDEWETAERYALAAVEAAENLDDLAIHSAALDALGLVHEAKGNFREYLDVSLRRLELSEQPGFTDLREQGHILLDVASASRLLGDYQQALAFGERLQSLSQEIRDIGLQVSALRSQAYSWFRLDRWDRVLEIEDKWRALEPSYANFYERVGAMCFMIALSAAVHALRGEAEAAAALRAESFSIMSESTGPPERWGRSNHY